MAESGMERSELLRREYLGQTARIAWRDLQTYYAGGKVVKVDPTLDLVEVAVQLGLDSTERFEQWIAAGEVAPVSDSQALRWYEENAELWAVVAAPWVLVQDRVEAQPKGA